MVEYEEPRKLWDSHKKKYSLTYSQELEEERFNIFQEKTEDEYKNYLTLKADDLDKHNDFVKTFIPENEQTSNYIDYRQKNCVTSVRNQGHCGSCWAQSVIGCLEGSMAVKYNSLQTFSPQQLVDCCKDNCCGCSGGSMISAMKYIIKCNGVVAENDYPYVAKEQKCNNQKGGPGKFKEVMNLKEGDENGIAALLNKYGPVSIGIDAGSQKFAHYKEGIFFENDPPFYPNHGVLCVGYGKENGVEYWIIKNSWGTEWGENGYMRLIKGHGDIAIGKYSVIGIS